MQEGAPDGYYRQMLVVNNQYPGPTIEANEGDTIIVNVKNKIPKLGTSLHWHGLFQNGTAFMDGAAGITQCLIPSGGSFQYKFKIDGQYGTYWWHAHAGAQTADGIHGALIVHSTRDPLKRGIHYDYDQILIMADWYHNLSSVITAGQDTPQGYLNSNSAPPPNSALFNGFGTWDCKKYGSPDNCFTQKPYELQVYPNKKYCLRIINAGAHAMIFNSVDGHTLSVIEGDDTPVSNPALNDIHRIQSHNGQRYSAILKTDKGKPGDVFWMRGEMSSKCFAYLTPDYSGTAMAVLRYIDNKPPSKQLPTTQDWADVLDTACKDLETSKLTPLIKEDAPTVVTQQAIFGNQAGTLNTSTGPFAKFFINGVVYEHLWNDPILFRVADGRGIDPSHIASLTFNNAGAADIIINNGDGIGHPYHLHAMGFWIVGEGAGALTLDTYKSVKFNTTNPMKRDTFVVPAKSWAVIRMRTDIPGVWYWHLAKGFAAAVVVQPDVVRKFHIPKAATDISTIG
ncbi:laccase, multicopper oxidase, benzenediol:oxygen oxidorectuctase [Ceratobasidium sp. 395]|nr:laccase, multicopper oxidase, benzenediol:oxygen oxidorectuctase [Ceratobasidium sp. 395]